MGTEHSNNVKNNVNKLGDTRGLHPNSLKNLRPNRNGRPPNDILDVIRAKLPEICPYDAQGRTWLEAEADAEMRQALTNPFARRDLLDRLYGSNTSLTGEIILRVKYDRSNERVNNSSA